MNELRAQLREWREAAAKRLPPWWSRALAGLLIAIGIVLPFLFSPASGFMNATIIAVTYAVMSLGLNVVVGFAGLLDLGYVAFYALGAYSLGWFGSGFFFKAHIHVLVSPVASTLPGVHLNFILVLIGAATICALAGALIGLPTLRLRGDYIAIVTLAFGEIIGVVAVNGQSVHLGGGMTLTAGNLGISAVDAPYFPGIGSFNLLNLRPWYWLIFGILLVVLFVNLRLRDSRLGRAWVALREDEVAAVSMGIPLVRTKLLAYSIGAAFGGMSGAFFGTYYTEVNAGQFQFGFSIFILAMVIIGGLGSIWGAVVGGLALGYINNYLIPDVLNGLPGKFGLNFQLTQVEFGIFGFLLVIMMVLRPQGLIPERRRRLELTAEIAAGDAQLTEGPGTAAGRDVSSVEVPAPPAIAVLRAEHVTKEFGGVVAVNDVSLDVPQYSIVSLIGPNGAGKTTLFNMLTGLYRPTQGRILLGERDITRARPDVITRYGVARTFQNIRLFGAMTAVENVMIGHHARMRAGLFGSIFRPPGSAARSGKRAHVPANCLPTLVCARPSSTSSPRSCHTETSGAWRSRGRWRPSRDCCCSTSQPPA